jgi:hypothetical protein
VKSVTGGVEGLLPDSIGGIAAAVRAQAVTVVATRSGAVEGPPRWEFDRVEPRGGGLNTIPVPRCLYRVVLA